MCSQMFQGVSEGFPEGFHMLSGAFQGDHYPYLKRFRRLHRLLHERQGIPEGFHRSFKVYKAISGALKGVSGHFRRLHKLPYELQRMSRSCRGVSKCRFQKGY